MIIDLILDRREYEEENPGTTYADFIKWAETEEGKRAIEAAKNIGCIIPKPYNPRDFYFMVLQYGGQYADNITYAMDYFGESLVRRALCEYIDGCNYNPAIKDYINSVCWLV